MNCEESVYPIELILKAQSLNSRLMIIVDNYFLLWTKTSKKSKISLLLNWTY